MSDIDTEKFYIAYRNIIQWYDASGKIPGQVFINSRNAFLSLTLNVYQHLQNRFGDDVANELFNSLSNNVECLEILKNSVASLQRRVIYEIDIDFNDFSISLNGLAPFFETEEKENTTFIINTINETEYRLRRPKRKKEELEYPELGPNHSKNRLDKLLSVRIENDLRNEFDAKVKALGITKRQALEEALTHWLYSREP